MSVERKLWQFRNNMNMLADDNEGENQEHNLENISINDEAALFNQMKKESYRKLIKLLRQYGEVKSK